MRLDTKATSPRARRKLLAGSTWKILLMIAAPVVAALLVLLPGPVLPHLGDGAAVKREPAETSEPASQLEIVNPNLASIDFRFRPGAALSTVPVDDEPFNAQDDDVLGDDGRGVAPLTLNGLGQSALLLERYTPAGLDGPLTLRELELLRGPFPYRAHTGWADGISHGVVPVPFLNWKTDQRSAFSIGISHQSYGEDTDVGVMGRWSIDF